MARGTECTKASKSKCLSFRRLFVLCAFGCLALGFQPDVLAQSRQTVQVKTFDQRLQVLRNIEISINGKPFVPVGSRGIAMVELEAEDIPIRSITVNDSNFEAASWNFSKGIVEVVVRPKSYVTVRIALRFQDGQPVRGTRITYSGSKQLTLISDQQGEFDLPLPVGEKVTAKDQFQADGFEISKMITSESPIVLYVDEPIVPAEQVTKEVEPDARPFSDFDLDRLDSIQSLTVFYAVFKDISITSLNPELQLRIDKKFNDLIGQREDSIASAQLLFMEKISDTSRVSQDVRNLLNQATLEMTQLEGNRKEFEEKIQLIADKLESGIVNLDEAQKAELLYDLDRLEALLIENESQFYKNQNDYREIINSLKEKYFDVENLRTQLTESEQERAEQQRRFRQQLIIIIGVLVLFAVLIILLISFSNRLRRQANDLKAANEEIKTINENLEQIVIRRTSALEESNRELDTFLYKASHDLRSPIRSIIGLCNISEHIPVGEYLGRVRSTTNTMDEMLTKLISISEIAQESGNQTQVNVFDFFSSVFKRYEAIINDKGIQFHFDCPRDLAVKSSKKLLENVIVNLLENAIFYSSLKGTEHARVEIQAKVLDSAWGFVVYDNGIGIETQAMSRLFEMFYKANEQSTGNGLGLYLVSKSVKALNGKVSVESETMRYTKIKVVLPLK